MIIPLIRQSCDILITVDQGMRHRQFMEKADVGIIVTCQKMKDVLPHMGSLTDAIESIDCGDVIAVPPKLMRTGRGGRMSLWSSVIQ